MPQHQHPSNPEHFGSQPIPIGELHSHYDRELKQLVIDHDRGNESIYDDYKREVIGLEGKPFNLQTFEQVLDKPGDRVAAQCEATYARAMSAFTYYNQSLASELPTADQLILGSITDVYREYGVDSEQLRAALKRVPKELLPTIQYSLILPAWHEANAAAVSAKFGREGGALDQKLKALKGILPKSGYNAILATLDGPLMVELWRTALKYGVSDGGADLAEVGKLRQRASSDGARLGMSAMLDRVSWFYGASAYHTDRNPQEAAKRLVPSSPRVLTYMQAHLADPSVAGFGAPKGWEEVVKLRVEGTTEDEVAVGAIARLLRRFSERDPLKNDETLRTELATMRQEVQSRQPELAQIISELQAMVNKRGEGGLIRDVLEEIRKARGEDASYAPVLVLTRAWHPDLVQDPKLKERWDVLRKLVGPIDDKMVIINRLLPKVKRK